MSFFHISDSLPPATIISCPHYILRSSRPSSPFLDEEMMAQMFGSCPRSHTSYNMKPGFRVGLCPQGPGFLFGSLCCPWWRHQPRGQVSAGTGTSFAMTLTTWVSESQSWWARGQAEVGCVHWWLAWPLPIISLYDACYQATPNTPEGGLIPSWLFYSSGNDPRASGEAEKNACVCVLCCAHIVTCNKQHCAFN